MKKTYTITIKGGFMAKLEFEFQAWQINKKLYEIRGNIITTQNANVVDVVTETFIKVPHLYTIETT
ncbi:MAG: hypothetical protein V3R81_01290 [Gammaproteobacteria bacterium]